MVVDAVRAYLDAASGLTELTRKRAVAAAKTLLRAGDDRQGGPRHDPASAGLDAGEPAPRVGHTIQALATDLIETSQANRDALNGIVAAEVERVLDRLDLVSRDDYDRLARRVAELERRLAAQRTAVRPAGAAPAPTPVHAPATEPAVPATGNAGPAATATAVPAGTAPDSLAAAASVPAGPAATATPEPVRRTGPAPAPASFEPDRPDTAAEPPVADALFATPDIAPVPAAARSAANGEPGEDLRAGTNPADPADGPEDAASGTPAPEEPQDPPKKPAAKRTAKTKAAATRTRAAGAKSTSKSTAKRSGTRGKSTPSPKKTD